MVYLSNATTRSQYFNFSVQKTESLVMTATARQQTRRNAHLEHLAHEAIKATYGDPGVAVLRVLSNPVCRLSSLSHGGEEGN